MSKKTHNKNELVIYKAKSGALELRGDFVNETVWATQKQIANVFGIERSVVTKHINNLLKTKEVSEKSNVQKMHIANSDKLVSFYSLDVILSVGYRTNSVQAIEFRQWATKTLKQHITEGYTIDPKRVAKNYEAFMESVEKVQSLLPASSEVGAVEVLELVRLFADTWFALDAYDKETLAPRKVNKKKVSFTARELQEGIAELKQVLMENREATENFAQERNKESIEGIIGNVLQSFGGAAVYPSIEEKAAHLLYFIIKNHPFVDGNKRSGAFAFVWFLQKAKVLNTKQLTPSALTALTLLIAESNPQDKTKMVSLVMALIAKGK